jgi:hypothetical protein
MAKTCVMLGLTLVDAVTVALQGPLAGGMKVVESPVELDNVPQGEAPPAVQFNVADPLKSFTREAESVSDDPCAAAVGVVLSPALSAMATGLTVKAKLAELDDSATDDAVGVAMQLAFSDDSAGGV